MEVEITTPNVFLDTSIIVSQNFLQGTRLKSLLEFGKKGLLNIYIMDITDREIVSQLKSRLKTSANYLKGCLKKLREKRKFLRMCLH